MKEYAIFNQEGLTQEQWETLIAEQSKGREIIFCEGKVFTAEYGTYKKINDVFVKKTPEEIEHEKQALLNQARIEEIKETLNTLDIKLIRANEEPGIYDETTGQTWLDHYRNEKTKLREELQTLIDINI